MIGLFEMRWVIDGGVLRAEIQLVLPSARIRHVHALEN
jgi:hypothetical protein